MVYTASFFWCPQASFPCCFLSPKKTQRTFKNKNNEHYHNQQRQKKKNSLTRQQLIMKNACRDGKVQIINDHDSFFSSLFMSSMVKPPFTKLATVGEIEIVKVLLAWNADPNLKNKVDRMLFNQSNHFIMHPFELFSPPFFPSLSLLYFFFLFS